MKNLIVIGHPDQQSFCYNGIFSAIKSEIEASGQELEIIDLYRDSFTRPRTAVIEKYKGLVTWVYSFVFGWRWSLWFKTKQFWSVPFVSQKKREKYLRVVKKDIQRDLKLGSRQ